MAGMRALGRLYNPVWAGIATAGIVSLKNCSGVGVLAYAGATATGTLTFTAAKTFGGSYVAVDPANGFGNPGTWYQQAASGTDAWTAEAASWSSGVLTVDGSEYGISYVDFLVSELADEYCYLKVLGGAAVNVVLLPHDLTVQRTPANLAIISA